jgi:hypothetical protein
MAGTLFRQVVVWDGSAAIPFPGDLLVHGNRIPRGGPEDRRRCRPRASPASKSTTSLPRCMASE